MAELLMQAYLRDTAHLPFDWSWAGRVPGDGCTCLSWVAGYVVRVTGRDPLAGLAMIRTRRAALAELRRRGGPRAVLSATLGAPRAAFEGPGVCLVRHRGRETAGLVRAGRSLLKTDGGVMIGPAPLLTWAV